MKKLLYFLIFLLTLELASAAILHGTTYDSRFTKLNDVVIEVNSTPPQRFVSKEGQYSFVLDPGSYQVTAKYHISGDNYLYSSDNVTITRNGYFLVDLFLVPSKKVEMPTGAVVGIGNVAIPYTFIISIFSIILVASLGFTVYKLKFSNQPNNEFDNYTNELLTVIKKEGGRTTQKDIRKHISLSEAKVSLMISELENKGIVKRIKKGRGNIIILEKK